MTVKTQTSAAAAAFMQSAAIFAASMQRQSKLGALAGSMPVGEGKAAGVIERQSCVDMPIVRSMDLSRKKGDSVEMHFIQPVGAYPIMGSEMAEGKGTGIHHDNTRVYVNQARFPIDLGSTMDELRSPIQIAKVGRPIAQSLMNRYMDQLDLVHLAGARGFDNNVEWTIPLESHEKFKAITVNPVLPPTKNRHVMADSVGGLEPFKVVGGEVNIQTTDEFTLETMDAARAMVEGMALPMPKIKIPGDKQAEDTPLLVMLVSSEQYHSFSKDKDFRTYVSNSIQRKASLNDHPLFRGDAALWNGVLLIKMPKPIRFFAGDPIRYYTDYAGAEAVATVPASFGTTHAIDRALLLGGQALAHVFGRTKHNGMPFFWNTETFDHKDKEELVIGTVHGAQKLRWNVDHGAASQWTDHGVMAIDTAVPVRRI